MVGHNQLSPLCTQAEQKARSLAEDAVFAAAWQERVKELKQEEGAEAAARLAEVRDFIKRMY